MKSNVFEDPIGVNIKARLINYASEKYKKPPEEITPSVERLDSIVEIVRESIEDCLDAEMGVFASRGYTGDSVPVLFLAGLAHALDVIKGEASIIGNDK